MPILPDPPADRYQADADSDIGQDIDRALHRVGDGEEGILMLIQAPNEQNSAGKADQLHQRLDGGKLADPSGKEKTRRCREAESCPAGGAGTEVVMARKARARRAGWPTGRFGAPRRLNAMTVLLRRRLEGGFSRRGRRRGVIILRVLVVIVLRQ